MFLYFSLPVSALGDTNYTNFCNCGKTIERCLNGLGAKQFYATGYADDGVGYVLWGNKVKAVSFLHLIFNLLLLFLLLTLYHLLDFVMSRLEVVVDPWLQGLWNAIKEASSKMASDITAHLKENADDPGKVIPDSPVPDVQLNLLSIADHQNCEPVGTSVNTDSKYETLASSSSPASCDLSPSLSAGCNDLACHSHGTASVSTPSPETQTGDDKVPHVALAASLTCSLPPLSESSLNVPALPPPYLDVSCQEVDTVEQVTNAEAETVFLVLLYFSTHKYFLPECWTTE